MLVSLIPAVLAVMSLALGAKDVPVTKLARRGRSLRSARWASRS